MNLPKFDSPEQQAEFDRACADMVKRYGSHEAVQIGAACAKTRHLWNGMMALSASLENEGHKADADHLHHIADRVAEVSALLTQIACEKLNIPVEHIQEIANRIDNIVDLWVVDSIEQLRGLPPH